MDEKDSSVRIPLHGGAMPPLPPNRLSGADEAAKVPGSVIFPSATLGAAAGSVYAYVRTSSQGNLFRITLPD